jgi:hypothetical protein
MEHHSAASEELVMAAPALLETYAVLTRLPPPYRPRPGDALVVMEGSWARAEVVAPAARLRNRRREHL